MHSNYVYFYLLQTRAATGQCHCLTRGRIIASFSYCTQFNHHKLGLTYWGEAKLKNVDVLCIHSGGEML